HHHEVGGAAVGDEGLGAVDDVAVAVALRGGAHALEVGAGAGLGHGDRRDPLAGADPGQPRPLLLLGGVVDHVVRGDGGAHAHTERGVAGVHQLLGDQVLHRRVAALSAVLLGHVQADEAGLPGAHPGLAVDVLLFGPLLLVG